MTHGNDNRIKARDISGGNLAPGGTVNQYAAPASSGAAELQSRLDELNRLLTAHAAALRDPEQLRDDTEQLGAQMRRDRPNRTVVNGLLASLTAGATGVSAVTSAVSGIVRLVSGLLN